MKSTGKTSFYSTMARLSLQTPVLCFLVYITVWGLRNSHCAPITGEPLSDLGNEEEEGEAHSETGARALGAVFQMIGW